MLVLWLFIHFFSYRIIIEMNTLFIPKVEIGDQGVYTCVGSTSLDSATDDSQLIVLGKWILSIVSRYQTFSTPMQIHSEISSSVEWGLLPGKHVQKRSISFNSGFNSFLALLCQEPIMEPGISLWISRANTELLFIFCSPT